MIGLKRFLIFLKRALIFLTVNLLLIVIALYSVMYICVHGPSTRARDLFVMSVKETSAVGFLANIYLSEDEIAKIMEANSVSGDYEETDVALIHIKERKQDEYKEDVIQTDDDSKKEDVYAESDGIKILNISTSSYKGKLAIISDPSRVHVGVSGKYGKNENGKTITDIAISNGACLATNAGGFVDEKGLGLGGEPIGMVITGSKLLYGNPNTQYEICGFTKDNIMIMGYMTPNQALSRGVRDAISFGPALVSNGALTKINGTGGGMNPRTAIGQREDGAVLILVIDGRQVTSFGATYQDIANLMLEYGAVNAFNLDGGSSSAMYYEGRIINSVATGGYLRPLPTAIIVK
jgi:exopolysaccharide biosynthesis protein